MRFLRLLREHLRQALSWRLVVCGVGVTLVMTGAISGLIVDSSEPSVWYMLNKSILGSGAFSTAICILPALTYSVTLPMEWKASATPYWIVRTGISPYAISKMIVSAVAGLLTLAVGMLLFVGIFSIRYPIYISSCTDTAYDALLAEGKIAAGLAGYILNYSLSGALAAACGTFVATFIPDPFVAASSPLLVYFTLTRLTSGKNLPGILNPLFWMEGIVATSSTGQAILEKFIVIAILCTGMSLAAIWQMKRRVRNA